MVLRSGGSARLTGGAAAVLRNGSSAQLAVDTAANPLGAAVDAVMARSPVEV